jgi:hypothetical protein
MPTARPCRSCVAVASAGCRGIGGVSGGLAKFMDSQPSMTGGQPLAVSVRLIGGPTAVVEVAGLRLLTDPTFSPPGIHQSAPGRPLTKTEGPALTAGEIGPIDVVLLSMTSTRTISTRRAETSLPRHRSP